jgi:hypothetical protein
MSGLKLHEKSSLRLFCAYERKGLNLSLPKLYMSFMHIWFLVLVLIFKELRNALEAQQVFFGHVCWALSLWGTGPIALDPTFGSFTLLKSVSHYMNQFLW